MNKSNIRSKQIKDFLTEKDELKKQLKETTKGTIKDLLGESVKESLEKLISESEDVDSYEEEEVDTDDVLDIADGDNKDSAKEEDADTEDQKSDKTEEEDSILDDEADLDIEDEDDILNDEGDGEEVWNDLEQYRDENGEYDLTGMDNDEVIRVLKVMNPETDGVRVVKSDNGTLDVKVPASDEDVEFIIDMDYDDSEENEFGVDGDIMEIDESELGYTDDYQSVTAMTTPQNNEINDKSVIDMKGGIPKDTKKRWAGNAGDMSPFADTVNEDEGDDNYFELELDDNDDDDYFEIELDEGDVEEAATTITHNNAAVRGTTISQMPDADKPARNGRRLGRQVKGTGESPISENATRKLNALINENKELRNIISVLKSRVEEAITVNYNLGKVAKLFTENTTSRQEKINIIKRFDEVKDIKEAKALYESIDKELKKAKPNQNNNGGVMQIVESKNPIKETTMYMSDEMNETLNLMQRLDALDKK